MLSFTIADSTEIRVKKVARVFIGFIWLGLLNFAGGLPVKIKQKPVEKREEIV